MTIYENPNKLGNIFESKKNKKKSENCIIFIYRKISSLPTQDYIGLKNINKNINVKLFLSIIKRLYYFRYF